MKKLLAFLLVFSIIACLFSACGTDKTNEDETTASANAGENSSYEYEFRDLSEEKYITPATDFAGGSGTEADPYQIADAAQLALIHEKITDEDISTKSSYAEANYILTADIAINDVSAFDSWDESAPEYSWLPIGGGDDAWSFSGTFDGNGYTVSGIYINTNCGTKGEYSTENYGLFDNIAGTVKNLNISKAYIAVSGNTCNVGSIAGLINNNALIENCNSDAHIICYDANVGGITGNSYGGIFTDLNGETTEEYPVIENCSFNGTIRQVKDGSMSFIGGIIGSSQAKIDSCINKGTIEFAANNVDSVGGIAGNATCGEIFSCKNEGNLNCTTEDESGLSIAGGIVGKAFVTSTGSEKSMSRGVTIKSCENTGNVSGQLYAGGIAGQASNDNNDYFIAVSDCSNTGNITAAKYIGGIIGYVNLKGDNQNGDSISVDACENKAELTGDTVGGIIGQLMSSKGDLTIKKCVNSGNLEAKGQNCSGIVAYMLMDSVSNAGHISIAECKNDGNLISGLNCGGIVSIMNKPVTLSGGEDVSVSVTSCTNNGSITTKAINGFIGGILGNWGLPNISTTISDCTNNGNLSFNYETDGMTDEEADIMTVSRIAGGIIGRVGEGLMLTTDSDATNSANIQSENAILNIKNCNSTGTLSVTDADAENIKNWFGGIIGNTSGEDGFSFFVDNCTYTGFDRGLGNDTLPDVGTKK